MNITLLYDWKEANVCFSSTGLFSWLLAYQPQAVSATAKRESTNLYLCIIYTPPASQANLRELTSLNYFLPVSFEVSRLCKVSQQYHWDFDSLSLKTTVLGSWTGWSLGSFVVVTFQVTLQRQLMTNFLGIPHSPPTHFFWSVCLQHFQMYFLEVTILKHDVYVANPSCKWIPHLWCQITIHQMYLRINASVRTCKDKGTPWDYFLTSAL